MIEALFGHRVYLDANVAIHLAEGSKAHAAVLAAFMVDLGEGRFNAMTSALTLTEALTPAFRLDRWSDVARWRAFLEAGPIGLVDPSREVFVEAARYRAECDLSALDALHVACAIEADCTIFLTQDRAIRAPDPLTILRLEDL